MLSKSSYNKVFKHETKNECFFCSTPALLKRRYFFFSNCYCPTAPPSYKKVMGAFLGLTEKYSKQFLWSLLKRNQFTSSSHLERISRQLILEWTGHNVTFSLSLELLLWYNRTTTLQLRVAAAPAPQFCQAHFPIGLGIAQWASVTDFTSIFGHYTLWRAERL